MASQEKPPLALIVGMPRAGTTWLCRSLNNHPEVCAFGETSFWGRSFVEPAGAGEYTRAQLAGLRESLTEFVLEPRGGRGGLESKGEARPSWATASVEGCPAPVTPGRVFARFCAELARAEGKLHAVEKTPHHLLWIDRIERELPGVRLIVTLREPFGFVRSYKHQGDRKPEWVRRNFERRYHPAAAALIWRRYLRAAGDVAGLGAQRVQEIWLQEIEKDPAAVLGRVQRFLGVEESVTQPAPAANTSFPAREAPDLGPEDIFWLQLLNRRSMRIRGFAPRRAPVGAAVLGSLLSLPRWAAWNAKNLRPMVRGSLSGYVARWL